jgi:secondary thiamine-phosphate synthase enzyme
MKILRHRLELATVEPIQIIDITDALRDWVGAGAIKDGLLTVVSPHTTARINVNENEPQLQRDMVTYLKRLAPLDGGWLHNVAPVDDRPNAHSHILGLMMNSSETIPVAAGNLVMGEWQSVFFVELDGPRPQRFIELHLLGIG